MLDVTAASNSVGGRRQLPYVHGSRYGVTASLNLALFLITFGST